MREEFMEKAEEWNKKVIAIDPKNKEAYYTLGVIAWLQFVAPDREARNAMGMKPEEQNPLKPIPRSKTLKADLKAKYWQPLTDGIEDEKKALEIDPEYENAMSYMNLLIRYRADLDDTKEAVPGRREGSRRLGGEGSRNARKRRPQEGGSARQRRNSRIRSVRCGFSCDLVEVTGWQRSGHPVLHFCRCSHR